MNHVRVVASLALALYAAASGADDAGTQAHRSAYALPPAPGEVPEVPMEMMEPAPMPESPESPEGEAVSGIPANPFPCLPKRPSPIAVRALYLTGWTVGIDSQLEHYAALADATELNAYVVDIKDMDGHIGYRSEIPKVVEIGAIEKRYDPRKVLDTLHAHKVRVIARIACFKDPVASAKIPELAIHTKTGALWTDNKKASWLNPYNEKAWAYLIDIAKEALALGFDEIQFDYVRFPSDGKVHDIDYGKETRPRYEAINGFLSYARKQLPNVVISADVFGIMCVSAGDTEGIGQFLELIVQNVDYLSPMVYPSHYAKGQVIHKAKYAAPDTEPYAVVKGTLTTAKERMAEVTGCETARMRPYLQDFTAKWLGAGAYKSYGAAEYGHKSKRPKTRATPNGFCGTRVIGIRKPRWNRRNP